MLLKSYSKVNLTLRVNNKLKKKNLHNIQSYYCLIDLFDEILIKKINDKKDKIQFKGKFKKFVKKDNSIIQTLKLLREKKKISNFYSVSVNKNIPVFAGLGGGTSNSFFLMKYLLKGRLSSQFLSYFEKKIGSDLRLFKFKQGFQENLTKLKNYNKKYSFYLLLVYPNIKCSTKMIYSSVRRSKSKLYLNFNKFKKKSEFIKFLVNQNNDLQGIVEKKHPAVRNLTAKIADNNGCYYSRMSGSGSVCFGLFKSKKTAYEALKKIKLRHPKYWLTVAKTI